MTESELTSPNALFTSSPEVASPHLRICGTQGVEERPREGFPSESGVARRASKRTSADDGHGGELARAKNAAPPIFTFSQPVDVTLNQIAEKSESIIEISRGSSSILSAPPVSPAQSAHPASQTPPSPGASPASAPFSSPGQGHQINSIELGLLRRKNDDLEKEAKRLRKENFDLKEDAKRWREGKNELESLTQLSDAAKKKLDAEETYGTSWQFVRNGSGVVKMVFCPACSRSSGKLSSTRLKPANLEPHLRKVHVRKYKTSLCLWCPDCGESVSAPSLPHHLKEHRKRNSNDGKSWLREHQGKIFG